LSVRHAQAALIIANGHTGVLAKESGEVALAHMSERGQLGARPAACRITRDGVLDAVYRRVDVVAV